MEKAHNYAQRLRKKVKLDDEESDNQRADDNLDQLAECMRCKQLDPKKKCASRRNPNRLTPRVPEALPRKLREAARRAVEQQVLLLRLLLAPQLQREHHHGELLPGGVPRLDRLRRGAGALLAIDRRRGCVFFPGAGGVLPGVLRVHGLPAAAGQRAGGHPG